MAVIDRLVLRLKKVRFLKEMSQRFPLLTLYLVIKPLSFLRYKNERRLFSKGEINSKTNKKSILFFTVHKCASTLVVKILRRLAQARGYVHVDLDGYLISLKNNDKSVFKNPKFIKKVFHSRGIYYGALRYFRNVSDIEKYKVVLMLRDPRDVITSMFFSISYSHTVFSSSMLKSRDEVLNKTIDEYVLEILPEYIERYNTYIDQLLDKHNILFLKYEEMVSDFESWLNKLAEYLDIVDVNQMNDISNELSFNKKVEDVSSHIRNITPGDYKNKLKPETIKILNLELGGILSKLGYSK